MDQNLVDRFVDFKASNQQVDKYALVSNKLILNEPLELFSSLYSSVIYRIHNNSNNEQSALSKYIEELIPSGNCFGVLSLSILCSNKNLVPDNLFLRIELKTYVSESEKPNRIPDNIHFLDKIELYILVSQEKSIYLNKIVYHDSRENIGFGRIETVHFKINLDDFEEIVQGTKFEFRLMSGKEILVENNIVENQIIELKGFYKAICNPQFKTNRLSNPKEFSNTLYVSDQLMAQIIDHINDEEKQWKNIEKTMNESEQILNETKLILEKKTRELNSNKSCFIITATMNNDPNNYIVDDFRKYRDQYLKPSFAGKIFIQFYYLIGPIISLPIKYNKSLQKLSYNYFVAPIYKRIKNKV